MDDIRRCPGFEAETFRSLYHLKEELIHFCRENGLQTAGSKTDLTDRIAHYLETGEKKRSGTVVKKARTDPLSLSSVIEEGVVCSERHRAFFREVIGEMFRFNVRFMEWLRSNAGRTYAEAVEEYRRISGERKNGKTVIGRQFEYNRYIRDFFADNDGMTLNDAVVCRRHKRDAPGHCRYEKKDLAVLPGQTR